MNQQSVSGHPHDLDWLHVPPLDFIADVLHTFLHRRYVPLAWLTARRTRFAFGGCDDEYP
jgi:hypothetical protein